MYIYGRHRIQYWGSVRSRSAALSLSHSFSNGELLWSILLLALLNATVFALFSVHMFLLWRTGIDAVCQLGIIESLLRLCWASARRMGTDMTGAMVLAAAASCATICRAIALKVDQQPPLLPVPLRNGSLGLWIVLKMHGWTAKPCYMGWVGPLRLDPLAATAASGKL